MLSDLDSVNAHETRHTRATTGRRDTVQVKFDGLSRPVLKRLEVRRLRVAAWQLGNGSHVEAVLVSLHDKVKGPRLLHMAPSGQASI